MALNTTLQEASQTRHTQHQKVKQREELGNSDRKQQAIAVELGNERKRLLDALAIAKIGNWETNLATLEVSWSAETCRIFEVDPETFVVTHNAFLLFVHPDDRDAVDEAFRRSLSSQGVNTVDHRIVVGDDRVKYVTETWQVFLDGEDKPIKAIGTCQDISERQAIVDKLRESEARLRRSQEISKIAERVASIGSAALDFRTGSWEWSDETYRIYGVTRENFIPSAETLAALVHPEERDRLLANIPAALKGITPEPFEYRIRRPNGVERILRREATLVRKETGTVIGIVGTVQDVTDIRAAEREWNRLQNRLRQAQRLEAIGQLAGGVAHDFNNILGAILCFARLLKDDLPEESADHGFVERILAACERGKDLVEQIMTFAGVRAIQGGVTDLGLMATRNRDYLEAQLPARIVLRMTLPEVPLPVLGDTVPLGQMLTNLFLNARDAFGDGGGIIDITVRRAEHSEVERVRLERDCLGERSWGDVRPGRTYGLLQVGDQGAGIPSEILDRIFEPFFTTKGRQHGTGLGLAVVHGVVESLGGVCHLRSVSGVGTVFSIYLPLIDHVVDNTDVPAEGPADVRGKERILIVDDELDVANAMSIGLKRLGYETVSVKDPREALAALMAVPEAFDIVITDQGMLGLSGLELIGRLKQIRPSIKAILCTGYAEGLNAEIAGQAGVDAFFQKPVDFQQIAVGLRRIMARAV